MKILTQYEEKLTTVPRWGIVRTIQKQSVAEHSFLVAVMAHRIAVEIFDYSEIYDTARLLHINRYALLHDQHEAFTGDIPSPVRPAIDKDRAEQWFDGFVNEKTAPDHDTKMIVKLADYLESISFLGGEIDLGNYSVGNIRNHIVDKFRCYCAKEHIDAQTQDRMLESAFNYPSQQDPLDIAATSTQLDLLDDDMPF